MRFVPARICALLVVCLATAAVAQERVYFAELNAPRIQTLTFDGTQWQRDPSTLPGGVDPFGIAATDHLFLPAPGFSGLALDAVDPATGLEIHRISTTIDIAVATLVSRSQQYAYLVGGSLSHVPTVSVVDLRPSSATFLHEVLAVQLAASGRVDAAALTSDGMTIYATLSDPTGANSAVVVKTIDLTAEGAPAVISTGSIPKPSDFPYARYPAQYLSVANFGGASYLFFARRDFYVVPIQPDRSIGTALRLKSGTRWFNGAALADAGATPRAVAVTDTWGSSDTVTMEEIVTLDLTPVATAQPPTVLHALTFNTQADGNAWHWITPSTNGNYIYVFTGGYSGLATAPAGAYAFSTADVLGGTATGPLASIDMDPSFSFATGTYLLRSVPVTPVPSAMTATSLTIDSGSSVIVNDAPHTITISGSNLATVAHAYLGMAELTVASASATSLQLQVPANVPAASKPILLIDASGATLNAGTVVVSNPPTYAPANVLYAGNYSENTISILNAATKTEVASSFAANHGPLPGAVSPDGKLLYVPNFRDGTLDVYSIVADPARGYGWNERIAHLFVGGAPLRVALRPDGKRLYVNTIEAIAILDTTNPVPVFLDSDNNSATTDPGLPAGITRVNLYPSGGPNGEGMGFRAIVLSADGQWLYAANNFDPHLYAIHVGNDVVTSADIIGKSISGAPAGLARSDGLALSHDGTKLYFTNLLDTSVRIFNIDPANGGNLTESATRLPLSGATPAARNIGLLPDGRFLFVSSAGTNTLHVFDCAVDPPAPVTVVNTGGFRTAPSADSNYLYVISNAGDFVRTLDERPGSATLHQIVATIGTGVGALAMVVSPGLATPPGANVAVQPAPGATLTFSDVTAPGNTTVTSSNVSDLPLPAGIEIQGLGVFYDVKTTATFSGPVQVCFSYDDAGLTLAQEDALELMHEDNGSFVPVTTSRDTVNNIICGSVSHFSHFTVARRVFIPVKVDIKPDSADNVVNRNANGTLAVAILGSPAYDTKAVVLSSLTLNGAAVATNPNGKPDAALEDVNGDGTADIVAHFPIRDLHLPAGPSTLALRGRMTNGVEIRGSDSVNAK